MRKSKGELIEHYCSKKPTAFYQVDFFMDCPPDPVMDPDKEGDALTAGQTFELMNGAGIRVLISTNVSHKDITRGLTKIIKLVSTKRMKGNLREWKQRQAFLIQDEIDDVPF